MDLIGLREKILSEYKYKIELHAHTAPASSCSQIVPEDMARIYSNLGYDAVVITNHFIYDYNLMHDFGKEEGIKKYLQNYYDTVEAGEKYNIKFFLGAEIRFTENSNDYLIYGLDEKNLTEIYDLLPYGVENFRKEYKMPNSLLIQAHPFRDGMVRVEAELLDGIETMNLHNGHNSRVGMAARYAKENGFNIVTAGSDFHNYNRGQEGAAAMLCNTMPRDSFDLARILKSKDYVFGIGGEGILLP